MSSEAEQHGYDQGYWEQLPEEAREQIRAESLAMLDPLEPRWVGLMKAALARQARGEQTTARQMTELVAVYAEEALGALGVDRV